VDLNLVDPGNRKIVKDGIRMGMTAEMIKKCVAYQTRKFREKKGNYLDKGEYLLLTACRWAGRYGVIPLW
jgi:hypothetical protein